MRNYDDFSEKESNFVLCVAVRPRVAGNSQEEDKDGTPKRIKNVAIRMNDKMCHLPGSSEMFPTIRQLIDSYIASRKPVTRNIPLCRGISRQQWELLNAEICFTKPEQILGCGTYGSVLKGALIRKNSVPIDVAVKRIQNGINEVVFIEIMQEARTMRTLDHSNVIKFHGVVIEGHPIMLVMEFMDGNSLSKMLKSRMIPNTFRLSIVFAIVYGLSYVHEMGFIHRDVAARNVLVSRNIREVKISDFGLSRKGAHYNMRQAQKIPVKWLSPEVLHYGAFSPKSDAWALGVTIWEIYNDGSEPYPKKKNAEVKSLLADSATTAGNVLSLDGCMAEEKPPPELCHALSCLFNYEPTCRPMMQDLVNMMEMTIYPRLTGEILDNCRYHAERRSDFHMKYPKKINAPRKVVDCHGKTSRKIKPHATQSQDNNNFRKSSRKHRN